MHVPKEGAFMIAIWDDGTEIKSEFPVLPFVTSVLKRPASNAKGSRQDEMEDSDCADTELDPQEEADECKDETSEAEASEAELEPEPAWGAKEALDSEMEVDFCSGE